jgi:hypothetical protein
MAWGRVGGFMASNILRFGHSGVSPFFIDFFSWVWIEH